MWPASALSLTNGPSQASQYSIHHSYAAVNVTQTDTCTHMHTKFTPMHAECMYNRDLTERQMHNAKKIKFWFFSTVWVPRRTEKWVMLGENTQAACHVSVYLLWLVLFLALCVHSSAGKRVIYYHLPCQSSPWFPPSISQSRQHCPPPIPPSSQAPHCLPNSMFSIHTRSWGDTLW